MAKCRGRTAYIHEVARVTCCRDRVRHLKFVQSAWSVVNIDTYTDAIYSSRARHNVLAEGPVKSVRQVSFEP